ncbi:hypothetical protein [Sphingomonas sp.]|nr:hypothetical protein [Sphingomonas sp.]
MSSKIASGLPAGCAELKHNEANEMFALRLASASIQDGGDLLER